MNVDNDFYYKYIHLMYGHDTKFSKLLLDFIMNPENGFETSQHLFVTPYKNVYEDLKCYKNVILDKSGKNLYKTYYKHCHLIISHSSEELYRILLTSRKIKNKIVYRYWGGIKIPQFDNVSGKWWEKLKLKLKKDILKKSFSDFAAIGVGNLTDIIDLSRILNKNTKYYCLSYASNEYYNTVNRIKQLLDLEKKDNSIDKKKILLGHRGTEENNHIDILKKLSNYDSKKFNVYIPLSYGDKEYIQSVEEYVKNNNEGNIIIIKQFMEFAEYAKFLSEMDIAIFDGYTSYALGNLGIILFFNKTVYLNENGVIAKALESENNTYRKISDIGKISYESFSKPMLYPTDYASDLCIMSIEDRIKNWNKLLSDFDYE